LAQGGNVVAALVRRLDALDLKSEVIEASRQFFYVFETTRERMRSLAPDNPFASSLPPMRSPVAAAISTSRTGQQTIQFQDDRLRTTAHLVRMLH